MRAPIVERVPFLVLRAHRRRAVGLGQAVDVGDVEAHPLHALDDGGGRRRAGDEAMHLLVDPGLHFRRRVDERQVHDRRAAVMGDPVLAHRVEDRLRLDLAQADVHAGVGGHRPDEAPAVAVEHRQRPQVDRVPRHAPVDDVGQRIEVRAAVMVDHALRIAGGAGRVVERDRIPLVRRMLPRERRIAAGDERFVVDGAEALAARTQRIDDVDDERLRRQLLQRPLDRRREFRCR